MSRLRVSCFQLLLKQYLLHRFGRQIAPHGRLLPSIDRGLSCLDCDFQIQARIHTSPKDGLLHFDERLTLQIWLGAPNDSEVLILSLQGMLAHQCGPDGLRALMPFSVSISGLKEGPPRVLQIQFALNQLQQPERLMACTGKLCIPAARKAVLRKRDGRRQSGNLHPNSAKVA